ncbi:MAG: hypothetical protein KGH57_00605 [Candidatus Micrarchaeota archaeon]|nr:hypothetical protein [Candidatus Micrarchaeota archaeon]
MSRALVAIFLFALLASANFAGAQLGGFSNLAQAVCGSLFSQGWLGAITTTATSNPYYDLSLISFLIVIAVIAILGITFSLGSAFGLENLKNFSRTEALESVFNIVLIIVTIGGLGVIAGASSFLANLSQAALTGSSVISSSSSSTPLTFQNLCNNYLNSGVTTTMNGALSLLPQLYAYQIEATVTASFMPNDWGFSISPAAGVYPWTQLLNMQLEAFILVGGIMSAVGAMMFIIYYLFPVFLYLGVLFRSFPWTRAAGGSMLALFISFYVIFPALLYPFSLAPTFTAGAQSSSCTTVSSSSIQSYAQLSCATGSQGVDEITSFVDQLSYSLLQVFAVIIAFIISFDLLERFGDLLGAPSLRSSGLLQKVI